MLLAAVATGLRSGPLTLIDGDFHARLLVLQLFLAINVVMGLPVAAIIEKLTGG